MTATHTETDRLRHDSAPLLDALREAGADIQRPKAIRCPFHEDKNPSAGIYCREGVWRFKCQTCGVGGDVFDIRARSHGSDVAAELKAASGNGETNHQPQPRQTVQPTPTKRVYASIEDIEQQIPTIRETYLYTDQATGEPDMVVFRLRLIDGRKSFMQARPVDGGFVFEAPPKPWPIYNRARIAQADCVVVVEGEKCVHALHKLNIVATTSPGGAGKAHCADWSPLAGKSCILWPDADQPDDRGRRTGIAHMHEVKRVLQSLDPPARVRWLDPDLFDLPDKGDAADFIEQRADLTLEQQREAVEEALTEAVTVGPSSEVAALVDDAIAGRRRVVGMPWSHLSQGTRALAPATVTLLVASPGATKSLMVMQAGAWWHEQGERIAILQLEDGRAFHLRRALAQCAYESGLTDDQWCHEHAETARTAAIHHEDFLDAFGACIHELSPDDQPTMQAIGDWIEAQADAGRRVIAVDPLSIAEVKTHQYIEDQKFIARVKRIVEQSGCSLILVMHPKKHAQGYTTDDIAGGAAFGRLAQTVIWLEHTGTTRNVTVRDSAMNLPVNVDINRIAHMVKTRNGRGQGLRIGMDFDPQTLRLRECGIITRSNGGDTA